MQISNCRNSTSPNQSWKLQITRISTYYHPNFRVETASFGFLYRPTFCPCLYRTSWWYVEETSVDDKRRNDAVSTWSYDHGNLCSRIARIRPLTRKYVWQHLEKVVNKFPSLRCLLLSCRFRKSAKSAKNAA